MGLLTFDLPGTFDAMIEFLQMFWGELSKLFADRRKRDFLIFTFDIIENGLRTYKYTYGMRMTN